MCIMRKNIYLMILSFIIISVTIVTIVQLEQFKTSSHYALASPQPKENVTITALVQRLNKEGIVKALLDDAVNKLRSSYPDLGIKLRYIEIHDLPPAATKDQMLKTI